MAKEDLQTVSEPEPETEEKETGKEEKQTVDESSKLQQQLATQAGLLKQSQARVKQLEGSQGDWQSEIQTLRQDMTQNMQLMAAMAYEGRPPEAAEDLSTVEKGDALKRTQAFIVQETAKNEAKRKEQDYFRKADAIYARAEKLYGDDVDTLHSIRNLIRAKDLDLAEKKIDKAEAKMTEEPTESKEPEGTFEKRLEEEKRKWAEEEGLLTTETGGPSASSMSAQEAKKEYIAGNITDEEAKRRGADFS